MPSRRDQIKLTDEELAQLLDEQRVVTVASFGPRGWPHLMPMWFTARDGEVWIWTFAKSQKVRNLERDPRATLQVEAGDEYHELRGAMIEAEAVIERDPGTILEFGIEMTRRYAGGDGGDEALDPQAVETMRAQAAKRVAIHFVPRRISSWDHRKLGGTY
jgi:PPOX class probable F420-dependent enzyme